MGQIRVLHIVNLMNRGGLETWIMNIYRDIDRDNVQFDFLTHSETKAHYNDEILALGGRIYSIPSRRQGYRRYIKSLNAFFTKHKEYRIIHSHASSLSNVSPLGIAKKHGVPVRILHARSSKVEGFVHNVLHKWNMRRVKSLATHRFACSALAGRWLFGKLDYTIIPNAVDLKKFAYNPQKRIKIREALQLHNTFVVGHVGRFEPVKNHDFLIDIFAHLASLRDDARLLLVGDGSLRGAIEEKVKQVNLYDKVIFTGVQSDVPAFLAAMDVFVFPSLWEGYPNTVLEAQANGLPCLISDTLTEEVLVTIFIKRMSLDASVINWCERILSLSKSARTCDSIHTIKAAGYDLFTAAKSLEYLYLGA